jgi:hypothetical protein
MFLILASGINSQPFFFSTTPCTFYQIQKYINDNSPKQHRAPDVRHSDFPPILQLLRF